MFSEAILKDIKESTKEPDSVHNNRIDSFKKFMQLKFPSLKTESWKYTDITKLDIANLELSSQEKEFYGLSKELEKKGVIFCDIKTALEKHYSLLSESMIMSMINNNDDKFTAMHASFWNDGVFIYVPRNVNIETPLKNSFITSKQGSIFSHTLIILSENSSLTYTEEHNSKKGEYSCFRNDAVEIIAKANSQINFCSLQDWEKNVIGISNWKAKLGRDSRINWIFGQFGGKFSRVKIDTVFSSPGSESRKMGVFYADGTQHFDITTNAFHMVENTTCDILVKGVLNGSSSSVFRGIIKIAKEAQKTSSYLSDHSLILSENAVSNSIPSLEIDANDVKASHGATIGKPNEEELFYLMARGLNKKEALRLLVEGYFSEVVDATPVNDLREKFINALQKKAC